jgi:hypothetical protein
MSEESAMEVVPDEVIAEEIDEFKAAFDLLEENISDRYIYDIYICMYIYT